MSDIMTLILDKYGVPLLFAFIFIYIAYLLFNKLQEEQEAHREESRRFEEAINNNTRAIERLMDLYERLSGDYQSRKEVNQNDKTTI